MILMVFRVLLLLLLFLWKPAGSKGDPGRINDRLSKAFRARVTDGNVTAPANVNDGADGAVPGVVVTFRASGSGDAGGYLVFDSRTTSLNPNQDTPNVGTLVTPNNRERLNANGGQLTTATGKILYVRTNGSGQADVDFQLGTNRKQDVTISAVRQSKVVSAYAGVAASGDQLVNPRSQSSQAPGRGGEYELRVNVEDEDGTALANRYVEFRTSDGTLENPASEGPSTNIGYLRVTTDTQGMAFVFFDPKDSSGSPRVTVHLLNISADDMFDTADRVIDDVVFNPSGVSGNNNNSNNNNNVTNTITISPPSVSGAPGDTRTITVSNPAGVRVNLSSPQSGFPESNFSPATGTATSFTSTVTLPSTDGTYTIFAVGVIGGVTVSDSATVTVETTALGTLTVSKDGAQVGTQQQILVSASPAPSSTLAFTVTSGGFRVGGGDITTAGSGRAVISVPTERRGSTR